MHDAFIFTNTIYQAAMLTAISPTAVHQSDERDGVKHGGSMSQLQHHSNDDFGASPGWWRSSVIFPEETW